jgi:hypothetical protein
MWATKPYRDAVAIQSLISDDAKMVDCDPKVRCLLSRAFVELETLKLRLRMKPAPKAIDTTKLIPKGQRRKLAGSTMTETSHEPSPPPAAPGPTEG